MWGPEVSGRFSATLQTFAAFQLTILVQGVKSLHLPSDPLPTDLCLTGLLRRLRKASQTGSARATAGAVGNCYDLRLIASEKEVELACCEVTNMWKVQLGIWPAG